MEFASYFKTIADAILTQAGITAFVLFIVAMLLWLDNRSHKKDNKELNEKIFQMGTRQIEVNSETNRVLDKVADAHETLASTIREKKQ